MPGKARRPAPGGGFRSRSSAPDSRQSEGGRGGNCGPFPERYANVMQISACEPESAVRGRTRAPAPARTRARRVLVLLLARALAGPLPPVPPRPGRAWRAPRAARSQPAAERARSPGCAPAARAPLRAQCLGSRAAFTAQVSEPDPRFCPRRPPGVTLRRGFGGRNPPWKHALAACVGEGLRAARSWEGGVRGRPLRL